LYMNDNQYFFPSIIQTSIHIIFYSVVGTPLYCVARLQLKLVKLIKLYTGGVVHMRRRINVCEGKRWLCTCTVYIQKCTGIYNVHIIWALDLKWLSHLKYIALRKQSKVLHIKKVKVLHYAYTASSFKKIK
jgi:hypothetical protein